MKLDLESINNLQDVMIIVIFDISALIVTLVAQYFISLYKKHKAIGKTTSSLH